MIDFYSWPPHIRIACLLAPFMIALPGVFMILFLAYRNLDTILTIFPNSVYVKRQKAMWGSRDPLSRFILTSSLAAVALWPDRHIRRGELDESEVRKLPLSIKRRMVIAWRLCAAGTAWLLLFGGVLKLSGVE